MIRFDQFLNQFHHVMNSDFLCELVSSCDELVSSRDELVSSRDESVSSRDELVSSVPLAI